MVFSASCFRNLFLLALVGAVFGGAAVSDASANSVSAGINKIMERVKAKANQGKTNEADFAHELLMFSDLQAKCKGRKADAAEVLFAKAGVYLMVIGDTEMGAILLDQVRYEFAGTPAAARAEAMIRQAAQQAPQRGGSHTGPGYHSSSRP